MYDVILIFLFYFLDYVKAFCSENDIAEISAKDINFAFTSQVGYARRQQGMTCKKCQIKLESKQREVQTVEQALVSDRFDVKCN